MPYAKLASPFYFRTWATCTFNFYGGVVVDNSIRKRLEEQHEVGLFAKENARPVGVLRRRRAKQRWNIGCLRMLPVPMLHHTLECPRSGNFRCTIDQREAAIQVSNFSDLSVVAVDHYLQPCGCMKFLGASINTAKIDAISFAA